MGWGMNLWAISIAIFCIGSLLGALNFIATTLDLRAKGMTLMRMPICTWAWFITSCNRFAGVRRAPSCLHTLDFWIELLGPAFFIPSGLVGKRSLASRIRGGRRYSGSTCSGSFGHPEVYIAILPSMGIVSHILINSMRKPLLSARVIIYSMMSIGFLSWMVWGHHMFVSGMNPFSSLLFSFPTLTIYHSGDDHDDDLDGQASTAQTFESTRLSLFALGFHLHVRQRRR